MVVEEVMTPEAMAVDPTASVHEVLGIMLDGGVRHVPVVEDGELIGIVSDRDLRAFWSPEALSDFQKSAESLSQPVSSVMSSDVVSVAPDADLGEAVDLMLDHKIGAVPVVREGTPEHVGQELVGMVSYVDVLRVLRDSV